MNKIKLIIIGSIAISCFTHLYGESSGEFRARTQRIKADFVPGQMIVKFKEALREVRYVDGIALTDIGSLNMLNRKFRVKTIKRLVRSGKKVRLQHRRFGLTRIYLLSVPPNIDVLAACKRFKADPNVEYAEPNYLYRTAAAVPNDPSFWQQWALHNTGQTGGMSDADIDAPQAWDFEHGDSTVVLSVIDTGVDYDHPDLAANIWTNPEEIPDNGIDDDDNGFVDDVHGWDFYNDDNSPMDDNGHGTHCAGIASAVTDNGVGVAGVSWHTKIMPVKFLSTGGYGSTADAISSIYYAVDNGAKVLSNSWGGGGPSAALEEAIAYADSMGTLFVAAAGNEDSNSPFYPAYYEQAVAVAATDHNDLKASFSNYGAWVDVSAPGVDILSTWWDDDYNIISGTSMATPFVSGLAGLLFSQHPEWINHQIRARIEATTDNIDSLNVGYEGLLGAGRVNAYRAVSPPEPYVVYSGHTIDDDAEGNGDGVVNPDEIVELAVMLENAGFDTAFSVSVLLTTTDTFITMVDSAESFGTIPPGGSAISMDDYDFIVDAATPSGHAVGFLLTITDVEGHTWEDSLSVTVYESYMISGQVTDAAGSGIPGSVVTYSGPVSGADTTDMDGRYQIEGLIVGTYTLYAGATGFLDSDSLTVSVPPSASGVNFVLRAPDISVAPTDLAMTLGLGQVDSLTLAVINTGDDTLSFKVGESNTPPRVDFTGWEKVGRIGYALNDSLSSDVPPEGYSKKRVESRISQEGEKVVLLLKDGDPWGYPSNEEVLTNLEIPYDAGTSSDIASIDLEPYDVVIVASDQPQGFYDEFDSYLSKFEDYVSHGGILEFHGADYGWQDGFWHMLPRGVTHERRLDEQNYIAAPGHPILAGLSDSALQGSYASHAHLLTLPADATVITTDGAGLPTTVEYGYGWGTVVATGMTFEVAYAWDWGFKPMLVNAISYSLSISDRVPWLSMAPTEGEVPPGGTADITVTFDAAGLEPDTTYTAYLNIESNDPDEGIVSVPVTLNVQPAPVLEIARYTIDDDTSGVSWGDGDTFAEAGETIELDIALTNVGPDTSFNATAILSTDDPNITITDSTDSYGNIAPLNAGGYVFEVASDIPDSHTVTFNLKVTDAGGYTWILGFEVFVTYFGSISGQVAALTNGLPVSSALITATGPGLGADTTGADGRYRIIGLPAGAYQVVAWAEGFIESDPQSVTLPPDISGMDFALTAPDIEVSVVELADTLGTGQMDSLTFVIHNLGDADLTYAISDGDEPTVLSEQRLERESRRVGVQDVPYVPDEVLVRFKPRTDGATVSLLNAAVGAKVIKVFPKIGVYHLKLESGISVEEAVSQYNQDPNVEYAEPNYILYAFRIPNDPDFPLLWGMHNTGHTGGTPDADIDAPEAWDMQTGRSGVLISVIDTGVDYNHEDLTLNMWTNPGEMPDNGIDDDGNGYVDDVRGWDFYNGDNDPMDDNGHGTHVSGTVAAVGDNGIGVAGVNWRARIMPLKFLSAGGSGPTSAAVEAVLYATMMGARVTSNSWGGGGYSQTLKDAIAVADEAGALFVAAAGNDGSDNDLNPFYPASYDLANVIAVAATDHNDNLASFSNYGTTSVDIAAPGVDVYSTFSGNTYGSISGTSMATPHVSGVAGLGWAHSPGSTSAQIKAAILAGADPTPELVGKIVSEGRLNASNTLRLLGPAWLSEVPNLGMVPPGGSVEITVIFDAYGLEYDSTYAAYINIASNDPDEGIISIPAELSVERAPVLAIDSLGIDDDAIGESSGDADGVVEAGETIELSIALVNVGPDTSFSATAVLSTSDPHITITDSTHAYRDIVPLNVSSYVFTVSPDCPDSHFVAFNLRLTDADGYTWDLPLELVVKHYSSISGQVVVFTGGSPIAGAVVTATSAIASGVDTTDVSGYYQIIELPGGTYSVVAGAEGFLDSDPQTVVLPPDTSGIDFALKAPDIEVTPTQLSASLVRGDTLSQILSLSNAGDDTLKFWMRQSDTFMTTALWQGPSQKAISKNVEELDKKGQLSYEEYKNLAFQLSDTADTLTLDQLLANSPWGIAIGPDGNIFYAGNDDGVIYEVTPEGDVSEFASGFGNPTGIAFAFNGELFVCNEAGVVYKISPDGTSSEFARGLISPWGMAFNAQGDLFVANGDGSISRISPDADVTTFVSGLPERLFGLAFDQEGNLYATTFGDGTVLKITPEGVVDEFVNLEPFLEGLAFDIEGNLYVGNGLMEWLIRVSPQGDLEVIAENLGPYLNLALDSNGMMFIASVFGDRITMIDVGIPGVPLSVGSRYSWFRPFPIADSVPPGGSMGITVTFGVQALQPDSTYTAYLNIHSNDPDEAVVPVPVELYVHHAPVVEFAGYTVDDDTTGESWGDSDEYIEAGEMIELDIELTNTGSDTAFGVTVVLSTDDPHITIIDSTDAYGDIAPLSASGYLLSIDPSIPDGHSVTFRFTITAEGYSWPDSFEVVVRNVSMISGRVTDATLSGIPGAKVVFIGAVSDTAVADSTGNYRITGLVAGAYSLKAMAPGFWDSDPKGIMVPPDTAGVDFVLYRAPDIAVSPDSFSVALTEGDSTAQTMTIRNIGEGMLTFYIDKADTGMSLIGGRAGDVILSFPSPASYPEGFAWDGVYLWNADFSTSQIYKIDPSDGSIVSSFSAPGSNPNGLAWDGAYLWLAINSGANRIYKIDPSDGSVLLSFASPSGYPQGLTWDGRFLWNSDASSDRIYKINPNDGTVISSIPSPGPLPYGLAWDGIYLWNVDFSTDMVYRIDPSDGTVVASLPTPGPEPRGLEWDGRGNLWIGDNSTDLLYLIDSGYSPINWFSAIPDSGSVLGGDSLDVTVWFNAEDTDQGEHYANLVITSNDPDDSPLLISAHLSVTDDTRPGTVTDLAVDHVTSSTVTLVWTASGDNGDVGTAEYYDIRYSTSLDTLLNWANADTAFGEPSPTKAGTPQTFKVTGLQDSTRYYFAMKAYDEVPFESPLSNVVSAYTVGRFRIVDYTMNDYGNWDGVPNPGERLYIWPTVENGSGVDYYGVYAVPDSSYDAYVQPYPYWFSSYVYIGDVPAGATVRNNGFEFWVSSYADSGHVLTIPMAFYDNAGQLIVTDTLRVGTVLGTDTFAPEVWAEANPKYTPVDSIVTITAWVYEGGELSSVTADIESPDETVIATITLYDDGINGGDATAGDRLFTGQWPVTDTSDFFVDVTAVDDFGNIGEYDNVTMFSSRPFVKTTNTLLVNAYRYSSYSYLEDYYIQSLSTAGYDCDVWNSYFRGAVDSLILNQYLGDSSRVIYFSPTSDGYFRGDDIHLQSYLDHGGKLFIIGKDIAEDNQGSSFVRDYLYATYIIYDTSIYTLKGVQGDPISDVPIYELSLSGGDGTNQDDFDEIDPIEPAVAIYTYNEAGGDSLGTIHLLEEKLRPMGAGEEQTEEEEEDIGTSSIYSSGTAALRVDTGVYKLVYLSFPFEAINTRADRDTLMARVLRWLATPDTTFDISGKISYYSSGSTALDSVLVILSGDQADSLWTEAGEYAFTELDSGSYVIRPEKDGDLELGVTAFDASLVLQYGVDLIDLDPYQKIAGNVSVDTTVSAYDASLILRHCVGLIEQFPMGQDWIFIPKDFPIDTGNWLDAPDSLGYFPLTSDQRDQDFLGIIYGDVSGNWRPGAGTLLARNLADNADVRVVSLEDIPGERGPVTLPVKIDNGSGVISAGLTINYGPQVLKAVGVSTTELTSGYLVAERIKEGEIKIALAGAKPLEEGGPLLNITFEVLEPVDRHRSSAITITDVQLNEGRIPAVARSGHLVAPAPTEFALSQNYPNPFNPVTTIQYQLPVEAKVRLEIYNLLGQRVKEVVNQRQKAGYYTVRWNGKDLADREVAAGIYLYRIQAGKFSQSKRMLLLK